MLPGSIRRSNGDRIMCTPAYLRGIPASVWRMALTRAGTRRADEPKPAAKPIDPAAARAA